MTWNYFKRRVRYLLFNTESYLNFRNIRYLPRWIVILLDSALVLCSIFLSFYIINSITLGFYPALNIIQQFAVIFLFYVASFFLFSTYSGLIRHSTYADVLKIAAACVTSMLALSLINYGYYAVYGQRLFLIPFLVIQMVMTFVMLLFLRTTVKAAYSFSTNYTGRRRKRKVLILGLDDDTIAVAEAINISRNQDFAIEGFISFQTKHDKIKILGKPIYRYDDRFYDKIDTLDIDGLLLIGNKLSIKLKNNVVDSALAHDLKVFNTPTINEWQDGANASMNIKQIQIEDLLERKPIALDDSRINSYLNNKTVLITGAAGSIGSEIARQVSKYSPAKIITLDQAETPLHLLQLELTAAFPEIDYQFALADVRNKVRTGSIFKNNKIDVVFHAAAYKHVPLIERNPKEAIQTNILGTIHLADLAKEYSVGRFVMVSTDKAVNPTNVMGASKRAAEIYVQSLQDTPDTITRFITTRFGNVLGSNGSVIPHFKKQIENGEAVTVTHEDIIRYFMTIPEACQLVLQAGTMGSGGEIFVFDMGKPVKIMDLAIKMIQLSGFKPYEDIDIKVIGLRPGEKLYEELLSDQSTTLPTHHEKIMIARDVHMPYTTAMDNVLEIISALQLNDDHELVARLKSMVPEFISQNSAYEILDQNIKLPDAT